MNISNDFFFNLLLQLLIYTSIIYKLKLFSKERAPRFYKIKHGLG